MSADGNDKTSEWQNKLMGKKLADSSDNTTVSEVSKLGTGAQAVLSGRHADEFLPLPDLC